LFQKPAKRLPKICQNRIGRFRPCAGQHHFAFLRTLNLRVSAAGGFFSVTAAGFEGWDFGGFVSTLLTDEAYRSMMPTIVEPDGASIVTRSVLCGS
jgi:hypothetical protein